MTATLEHALEREVLICARRETVFRFFTDTPRFAAWWGPGSSIEPRPGGAVRIVYPNGVVASGQVLELVEPERIVFSYGYEDADPAKPVPPGGSRVVIRLEERLGGTWLHLRHELPEAATRDHHVHGWRYQLAVFANVVAAELGADLASRIDRFLAAWSEPDAGRRRSELGALLSEQATFRDAYSCTRGLDDLVQHLAAAQVHMPGLTLVRQGEPRHCQGTVLADWQARGPDGAVRGRGTNVYELDADGRFARVVGLWG